MTERPKLYEGLFIVKASLSEDARGKAFEKVKQLIESMNGEVAHILEMGKRRLAYQIGDQREGYYHVVYFNVIPSAIKLLHEELRLNEDLVRFMMFQTDKVMEKLEFKPLAQAQ